MGGRTCRLEDTLGHGLALYALDAAPASLLDAEMREYLAEVGCEFVEIDPAIDAAGVYRAWFLANGCRVALVRPDFYVFGTAATPEETSKLVRRLRESLARDAATAPGG